MKTQLEADRCQTVRELAEELGVGESTIFWNLKSIAKVEKFDKWVPHELNEQQKRRRLEVCFTPLLRNKHEPLLDRIVTCDEKCILYGNQRRSALDRDEAPKHMPKPSLHPMKVMVTVW